MANTQTFNIKILVNTGKAASNTKGLEKVINQLSKSVDGLGKSQKNTERSTETLSRRTQILSSASKNLKAELSLLKNSSNATEKEFNDLQKALNRVSLLTDSAASKAKKGSADYYALSRSANTLATTQRGLNKAFEGLTNAVKEQSKSLDDRAKKHEMYTKMFIKLEQQAIKQKQLEEKRVNDALKQIEREEQARLAAHRKQEESYNRLWQEASKFGVQTRQSVIDAQRVGKAMQRTASLTNQASRGFAGSTNAAINFNRVISDMPYGIQGVANNLEMALFSFREVTKGTKGFTGSLKALGSAMFTGPGAILTAVTLIPTAIIMFQKFFKSSSDAAVEAAKNIQTFSDRIDELLTKDLDSPTISNERKRLDVSKQIQAEFELELQKLKDQQKEFRRLISLASEQSGIITLNAEQQARFVELSKSAQERTSEIKRLEQAISKQKDFQADRQAQIKDLQDEANSIVASRIKGEADIALFQKEELKRLKDIIEANSQVTEEKIRQADLDIRNLDEQIRMNEYLLRLKRQLLQLGFSSNIGRSEVPDATLESPSVGGLEFATGGNAFEMAQELQQAIDSGALRSVEALRDALKELNAAISEMADGDLKTSLQAMSKDLSLLAERSDQLNKTLESGIENTISSIAFSLASGENLWASLLNNVANMAAQLGQLAIGIGIAIDGIRKALKTLNPVAAIGAGVALLALAGFARSRANAISSGNNSVSGSLGAGVNQGFNNGFTLNTYLDGTRVNQSLQFSNLNQSQRFGS